ncbi:hypothetical protein [Streptomyces albicerus]|uniref:hypothetical protein n=1 Tax=Streptomyces albicerus TaxID=2569859 RepID=UPI00124B62CB|nr:hypothetical protein [Streptomyces albicerus]
MTGPTDEGMRTELPARRPREVAAAVVLLITSAVIGASIAANDPEMTQFVSLLLIVAVVSAIRVRRGGRKARVTATVTAVLFFLYLVPHAVWGFVSPGGVFQPDYAVRGIIAIAASGAGVILLYTPTSRAYFRAPQRETTR